MTMRKARFIIAVVGSVLPFFSRLPQGSEWLAQYTDTGFGGWMFLSVSNAIAWGCILAVSSKYERPVSLLVPCVLGFGFLAWAHGTLDLSADPQAAIALVIIPIYALVPIVVGGKLGYVLDRKLRRKVIT